MERYKKLTILHSNDMHGDFVTKDVDRKLVGGVSMLSGYVDRVRRTEKNVVYCIAGDMFRGSLIDSEYKGISTIEIMNMLAPDVASVGNHEVDYGIAHLLFLEKCARFPIINANIYIKSNHVRLFQSHYLCEMDGMKILFIGILTEEVLSQTKKEKYIGTLVDVEEASNAVGRICDSYQTEDIDLTVLLTHIGIEADRKLAEKLNRKWGVDLIIGGHSHTLMESPEVVAGIPIVQAASGTNQIGRFDLTVDTKTNDIEEYSWTLVPIDEAHCPRDYALEDLVQRYKEETDQKYDRYITRFEREMTHPARNRETELGNLFADILAKSLKLDLMLVGSGSMRREGLGPIVLYRDFLETYPYQSAVYRVYLTGEQMERMIRHIFREESFNPDKHMEYYQFSKEMQIRVSAVRKSVLSVTFRGKEIEKEKLYRVGIQDFHFLNMKDFLGLEEDEVTRNGQPKLIAQDDQGVIEEYLSSMKLVRVPKAGRWIAEE